MRLRSESALAPDWSSWWHGRSVSEIVELRGSLGFIREGSQGGCKLEGGGKSPPSASCETSCEEIWANLTSHSQSLESLLCEVWWGMRLGDMESRMDVCSCYLWGTGWNTTHSVTSFLKLERTPFTLTFLCKVSRLKWERMWVISFRRVLTQSVISICSTGQDPKTEGHKGWMFEVSIFFLV